MFSGYYLEVDLIFSYITLITNKQKKYQLKRPLCFLLNPSIHEFYYHFMMILLIHYEPLNLLFAMLIELGLIF